jgi:hypothetical protein
MQYATPFGMRNDLGSDSLEQLGCNEIQSLGRKILEDNNSSCILKYSLGIKITVIYINKKKFHHKPVNCMDILWEYDNLDLTTSFPQSPCIL